MMAKRTKREIGNEGEDLACSFLKSKGWRILDRNYIFDHAEVDIIAYDDTAIVFVEVKLRSSTDFGHPIEYVTEDKVRNVFKAAEAWMYEQNIDDSPMRFDIIGIVQKKDQSPEFSHIEDAFR